MSKKETPLKTVRHLFEYFLFLAAAFSVRWLSADSIYHLGRALGTLAFFLGGKRKRIALTNLNIAFGDSKSLHEKNQIVKKSFIHLSVSALQCLWLVYDPKKRVHELIEETPEGLEILKRCLERKKGIFFLTAHYGNWEAMGISHGYLGVSFLYSIVRRLDNPYLEKQAYRLRTISGNGILYREEPPIRIVRAMKNNHSVAVMMDQNTVQGGVFVDFFGKPAATPRSLALLSYLTGAAILPLFCYPAGKGRYKIQYGPELKLEKSGDKDKDVLSWTRACMDFMESAIRKYPEHWMWGHRRWKTRPAEEKGEKIY
ncbi:MAG: lysophospholipid acyltransferase family protein [Nitrospinaceae bacterium]